MSLSPSSGFGSSDSNPWRSHCSTANPRTIRSSSPPASGRRAVAFDLPGFGESSAVRGARYFDLRAPFYAAVVDGVRRELDLRRPHLVGHSLGTGVAFVSAVTDPDAFRSLVLVAPGGL